MISIQRYEDWFLNLFETVILKKEKSFLRDHFVDKVGSSPSLIVLIFEGFGFYHSLI